jgi:hypothetical protein
VVGCRFHPALKSRTVGNVPHDRLLNRCVHPADSHEARRQQQLVNRGDAVKLVALLLAIVITTVGVIVCDEGIVKQIFMVGFFCSLGIAVLLLIVGNLT